MIHRAEHNNNKPFTMISTEVLSDERLSFQARGFLCYLLSFSDEWSFNARGLASMTGLCPDTIVKLTAELKAAGYISIKKSRTKGGKFKGSEWDVFEVPRSTNTVYGKHRIRQTPYTTKPYSGNVEQITNINITKNNIKQISNGNKKTRETILETLEPELRETFIEFIKMRKTIKAPLTDKALELAINKARKISGGDPDMMRQIVEQSIANSWRGLFPVKDIKKATPISNENPFTKLKEEEGLI